MHDPFFTTEADEMSRAFDPTHTDMPPTGPAGGTAGTTPNHRLNSDALRAVDTAPTGGPSTATPRRAPSSHAVCPFCGCINETSSGSCRQCGMENTQATRQATRSKIGPWFVWQTRNPSAPGMNWATLMSLVEKGRITPRSVVRGPTTGQLWRFAARVKGLSREFGTCWHCGVEVKKAARLCPSCKRLQQPPANPDTLLEVPDTAPFKPVINPKHPGLLSLASEIIRRETPPPETPASETAPVAAPTPFSKPSMDPTVPVIDMGDELLPLGLEMRTFRLDDDAPTQRTKGGVFRRILIAAVLTFVALAPVLYLNPQVRPHYVHWYQQFISWAKHLGSHSAAPAADAIEPLRVPDAIRHAATPLWSVPRREPKIDAKIVAEPMASEPLLLPRPSTEGIQLSPGGTSAPAATPPLITSTATAPVIQISPPPMEPQAAERRSWELYKRAIECEQRDDYSAAIKSYERIEQLRLPEGAGPMDVESRLQLARQLLKLHGN